jgi:hypothetical protein
MEKFNEQIVAALQSAARKSGIEDAGLFALSINGDDGSIGLLFDGKAVATFKTLNENNLILIATKPLSFYEEGGFGEYDNEA